MNQELKHRLVGALVFLALAVALWPLLFETRDQVLLDQSRQVPRAPTFNKYEPSQDIVQLDEQGSDVAAPSVPGSATQGDSRDLSGSPAPAAVAEAVPPAGGNEPEGAVQQDNSPVQDKEATGSAVEAGASAVQQPRLDDKGLPVAWVLQVASLSKRENAERLRDQLLAKGFPAYITYVATDSSQVARVFVGPKVDQQHLINVKKQLDKEFRINSVIMRFEP